MLSAVRDHVKMSMSNKKLNFLSFLFEPPPPPQKKLKLQKVEQFCNVSVNSHAIDGIKTKIKNKANLTTYIVEKYIYWILPK